MFLFILLFSLLLLPFFLLVCLINMESVRSLLIYIIPIWKIWEDLNFLTAVMSTL